MLSKLFSKISIFFVCLLFLFFGLSFTKEALAEANFSIQVDRNDNGSRNGISRAKLEIIYDKQKWEACNNDPEGGGCPAGAENQIVKLTTDTNGHIFYPTSACFLSPMVIKIEDGYKPAGNGHWRTRLEYVVDPGSGGGLKKCDGKDPAVFDDTYLICIYDINNVTVINVFFEWIPDPTPTPGPQCAGDCTLTDANACQAGGKPAECRCLPNTEGLGVCQTCPYGVAAADIEDLCPPLGSWSARITMKIPPGDVGGGNTRELRIAEKVQGAADPVLDQFGCDKRVSFFPTQSNVVHIDKNLSGGFKPFYDCPGQPSRPGGLVTPLDPTKSYVIMLFDGSQSCTPIIDLPIVQNTCRPPICPTQCGPALPTGQQTCPEDCGICKDINPDTNIGACKPPICGDPCDPNNPTCPQDGCTVCKTHPENGDPTFTCGPPSCNETCGTDFDCGKGDGCTVCDAGSKTCKPPPPVCAGPCDYDSPSACPSGGTGPADTCVCVRNVTTPGGTCKPCPTGTVYDPITHTCQPPPVCAGPCDYDSPSACPSGGTGPADTCVCVRNVTTPGGTCKPCPTGTVYDPITHTCQPPPACTGPCDYDSPSACPSGGTGPADTCVCVRNVTTPGGTCRPCTPGTTYNPVTNTCDGDQCNETCDPTRPNPCPNSANPNQPDPTCQACVPNATTPGGTCRPCTPGTTYNPVTNTCDGDQCNETCDPTRPNPCPNSANPNQPDPTCQACVPIDVNNPSRGNTCQPPPACNSACDTRISGQCPSSSTDSTKDCPVCTPTKPGETAGTCKPKFFCDQTCDLTKPQDCAEGEKLGCDICRNKDGGGTSCQPFSKNFCQCDAKLVSKNPIIPGQKTTFDAFFKIEGPDINHAELKSVKFRMVEVKPDGQTGTVILQSEPITPVIIESTSSVIRYRASWSTTIPISIKTGLEYRVFVPTATSSQFGEDFKCERKRVTALGINQRVLAATATPWWFFDWCRIIPFSRYLFGACKDAPVAPVTPVPSPSAESNLQLKTFAPAKITNQSCSQIQFKFDTF